MKQIILPVAFLSLSLLACSDSTSTPVEDQITSSRDTLGCSELDSFPCSSAQVVDSLATSYRLLLTLDSLPADTASARQFLENLDSTAIHRLGKNIAALCVLPDSVRVIDSLFQTTISDSVPSQYNQSTNLFSNNGTMIFQDSSWSGYCVDECNNWKVHRHTTCQADSGIVLDHLVQWPIDASATGLPVDYVTLTVKDWSVTCSYLPTLPTTCVIAHQNAGVWDTLAGTPSYWDLVLCDTSSLGQCAKNHIANGLDSLLLTVKAHSAGTAAEDSLYYSAQLPLWRAFYDSTADMQTYRYCQLPDSLWHHRTYWYGNTYDKYTTLSGNEVILNRTSDLTGKAYTCVSQTNETEKPTFELWNGRINISYGSMPPLTLTDSVFAYTSGRFSIPW